jgi:hypothetical protein
MSEQRLGEKKRLAVERAVGVSVVRAWTLGHDKQFVTPGPDGHLHGVLRRDGTFTLYKTWLHWDTCFTELFPDEKRPY